MRKHQKCRKASWFSTQWWWKKMVEEKPTSCENSSVKVFEEGWRTDHLEKDLNTEDVGWSILLWTSQDAKVPIYCSVYRVESLCYLLIMHGLFQEALKLQSEAGTLWRCLIQLDRWWATLLKMRCFFVTRCLSFNFRLGVSALFLPLQIPRGLP